MTCDIIRASLMALLDSELSTETAAEIERHLAACPECAQARVDLEAARELAASWSVDAPDITERVLQAVALDDQSLLMDEMKRLRAEMQDLRAEVAALRRQLSRPADTPAWFPPTRTDFARMENDPWNSIRS